MSRFRQVKNWGNSLVIVLSKFDTEDLNVKSGDWIDVEDAIINHSLPEDLKAIKEQVEESSKLTRRKK